MGVSICNIELALKPSIVETGDDQLTVEALCVEIGNPSIILIAMTKRKPLSVQRLCHLHCSMRKFTMMKLTDLDEQGRWAAEKKNHHELGERIGAVTDNGYRAMGAG